MLIIRSLNNAPELAPVLAEWQHQAWGYQTAAELLDFLHLSMQGQALPITFTAHVADQLVGSVSLCEHEMEDHQPADRRFWLGYLFVHGSARGQGVGRQLMAFIENHAARFGITRLYLYTANMAGLYATLGWQEIDRLYYQGEPVTVMTKALPDLREGLPAITDPAQMRDDSEDVFRFNQASKQHTA
jgi:GNAT superfamily N-acetyltransferase